MYRPKKTALKPFLEVDPEHHAEGDTQGDSEDDIGEDLAGGAFHGVSLSYRLDGAGAPEVVD